MITGNAIVDFFLIMIGTAIFIVTVIFILGRWSRKNFEKNDHRLVCKCGRRGKIERQVAHFGPWPVDYIFAKCGCGYEWSFHL